jgi:predicted alpha/beta superfamily hydrolase
MVAAAEHGYPVLYVLDGYWYFSSALEAVRKNAPNAVVVGIGYPDDEGYVDRVIKRHQSLSIWFKDQPAYSSAVFLERFYDLTLPASDEVLAAEMRGYGMVLGAQHVGGLDSFLEVLETEIKPRVAAMAPVDVTNQIIFGHSLGGLAVLRALFAEPRAFRTFVAASPSIWWNDKAVLLGEAGLRDAVRAGARPRVLITMGSEEQTPDPKVAASVSLDADEFAAGVRKARMVDNARELTERLRALPPDGCLDVEFALFAEQSHGIAPWPAIGRTISFALRK